MKTNYKQYAINAAIRCLRLFRADSFASAEKVYRAMFNFRDLGYSDITALAQDGTITFPEIMNCAYLFLLMGILLAVVFRGKEKIERNQGKGLSRNQALTAAVCFVLALLCMGRESVFIYFNF